MTIRYHWFAILVLGLNAGCSRSAPLVDCRSNLIDAQSTTKALSGDERLHAYERAVFPECKSTELFRFRKSEYLGAAGHVREARLLLESFSPSAILEDEASALRFTLILDSLPLERPDFDQAMAIAEKHVRDHPRSFKGYMMAGAVNATVDDTATAVAYYDKAKALATGKDAKEFELLESYYALAMFNSERDADTFRVVSRLVRLGAVNWQNPDVVIAGAYSAVRLGRPDEAAALLAELESRNPTSAQDPFLIETKSLIAKAIQGQHQKAERP